MTTTMPTRYWQKVSDLKPHPKNEEIYGAVVVDDDFVEDVKRRGITQPLVVTKDNVIVCGHRRRLAAKLAGLEEVLVTVFESDDELDVVEELVRSNHHTRER